jgi:hypothetical protein
MLALQTIAEDSQTLDEGGSTYAKVPRLFLLHRSEFPACCIDRR